MQHIMHMRSTGVAYAKYVAYAKCSHCICEICCICEVQVLQMRDMLPLQHDCHAYAIYEEYARYNSQEQLVICICNTKEREVVAPHDHHAFPLERSSKMLTTQTDKQRLLTLPHF